MTSLNDKALAFRALHKPGTPVVLANVYDALTAETIASLPNVTALATASKAIALAAGMEDEQLTLDANLAGIRAIAPVAARHGLPLTADLQDGYGAALESAVAAAIAAGAVGANLEDSDKASQALLPVDAAAARISRAVAAAAAAGVPDFVVNARTDALLAGGDAAEAVRRGRAYLDAGAACVFVWGGAKRGGMARAEVEEVARGLGGRVNVSLVLPAGKGLGVEELAALGVCRISVGPKLQALAMEAYKREATKFLPQRA